MVKRGGPHLLQDVFIALWHLRGTNACAVRHDSSSSAANQSMGGLQQLVMLRGACMLAATHPHTEEYFAPKRAAPLRVQGEGGNTPVRGVSGGAAAPALWSQACCCHGWTTYCVIEWLGPKRAAPGAVEMWGAPRARCPYPLSLHAAVTSPPRKGSPPAASYKVKHTRARHSRFHVYNCEAAIAYLFHSRTQPAWPWQWSLHLLQQ